MGSDAEFASAKEFRTVMDQVWTMMSEDEDMGPKLRDADVPQRFEFDDVDFVIRTKDTGYAALSASYSW